MDRQELRRRLASRVNAVRFEDLRRLLELSGWELARVHGSHHIFARGSDILSLPYRRGHVLPVYVKEVLRRTREEGDDV